MHTQKRPIYIRSTLLLVRGVWSATSPFLVTLKRDRYTFTLSGCTWSVVARCYRTLCRTPSLSLPRVVTHCNTLQHTATLYSTLQHSATLCNTLQHSCSVEKRLSTLSQDTVWNTFSVSSSCNDTLQHTAAHCNTLQ